MDLVKAESKALKNHSFEIPSATAWEVTPPTLVASTETPNSEAYATWLATNTFEQKQKGFHAVYVRILNGNISSTTSRSLIEALTGYIGDDIRITINQGLMLKICAYCEFGLRLLRIRRTRISGSGSEFHREHHGMPGNGHV